MIPEKTNAGSLVYLQEIMRILLLFLPKEEDITFKTIFEKEVSFYPGTAVVSAAPN